MFQFIKMHFGRRRASFLFNYLLARAELGSINRILPIIEKLFDDPWMARAELKIRFSPGGETNLRRFWRLLNSHQKSDFMHWDAPITVSIYRKRRSKERQALCMSFYIRSGILYIAQMQGVPGTDMPKPLRSWPKLFIDACKQFACQRGLREVRVPKATTLPSFHYPHGRSKTLTKDQKDNVDRIRRDMKLIYDNNALQLGLISEGNWYTWRNVAAGRDYRATVAERVFPIVASLALVTATTAILSQLHAAQTVPQRLIYFYLFPLGLISILYTHMLALTFAAIALLCADYFLQDPIYSFYTSEYPDLIWFAGLATLEIQIARKLFRRSDGETRAGR